MTKKSKFLEFRTKFNIENVLKFNDLRETLTNNQATIRDIIYQLNDKYSIAEIASWLHLPHGKIYQSWLLSKHHMHVLLIYRLHCTNALDSFVKQFDKIIYDTTSNSSALAVKKYNELVKQHNRNVARINVVKRQLSAAERLAERLRKERK